MIPRKGDWTVLTLPLIFLAIAVIIGIIGGYLTEWLGISPMYEKLTETVKFI